MQRYQIHQINETTWELRAYESEDRWTVLGSFTDGVGQNGYDLALQSLSGIITAERASQLATGDQGGDGTTSGDGLLPEVWIDDQGLAFSRMLDGGRDFSQCQWSWRDPALCLVPLMFQTETDYGHFGAELAGFVESFTLTDGTVHGRGRFYDSEVGIDARDKLLDGRRFGVSVDPSERVEAEYHEECIEHDEDGFCEAYDYSIVFTAYEIAGVTMTPFPGFEEANIILDTSSAASIVPVRASLTIPDAPPRAWLSLAEPRPGQPFLDGDGGDVLVEQRNELGEVAGMACPLTIRDDGLVYGHLTWWGQCHVADPWGAGVCASAQPSSDSYLSFHHGVTRCADGSEIPTGVLTVGCEHSTAFDVAGVRDHLAHAGMSWASVHVVDGEYGPWLCGVLRPGLTESQVALLRRLSLSGEWVGELAGILAVNTPGLPVQRALAASAFHGQSDFEIPKALRSSAIRDGKVARLVGSNIVHRCVECQKRAELAGRGGGLSADDAMLLRRLSHNVEMLLRRTNHLVAPEAEAARARLAAGSR